MDTYLVRKDVDKYAHCASLEEIAENDYNLNIPRYVDNFEKNIEKNRVTLQNRQKSMMMQNKYLYQCSHYGNIPDRLL